MNMQTDEFDDLAKRYFYACQEIKRLRDELEFIEGLTTATPGLSVIELGLQLAVIGKRANAARSVVPPEKTRTSHTMTEKELRQAARSDTSCVGAFARARPRRAKATATKE